jgi:phage major head subunit gpT-like protein
MGTVQSLSYRNIRGNYFLSLEQRASRSWVPQIASMVTTDQPLEVYKWLGQAPGMKKWAGERERQQLRDAGLTIVNDKFTATIEADVDDVTMDKTGQLMGRVRDLGSKAAILPDRIISELLEANGTAYDGVAFYGTHVKYGTAQNLLTLDVADPDDPTSAEMAKAILLAIQAQMGFKDENGDPVNEDAMSFLVMVPPKFWSAAVAAKQNQFTSAGVSNTLINAGVDIQIAANARLTGTAAAAGRRIHTFRTDANVRALLWQERELSDAFKTLGAESDNGFWKDSVAFGAKRVGQAALGRFELATRTELT